MNYIYRIWGDAKIDPDVAGINPISANQVLENTLNTVYFAAGAFAVVVIVLSGYTYATSMYDPSKVEQAKNAILYASVGLFITIVAFTVTQFIIGSL